MSAMSDLVVRLGATTAPFDKKMNASQRVVGRFRGAIGGLGMKLGALAGAYASVQGLRAMGGMLKRNLELIDATGKLSDRIGIQTEKLLGLRHAADQTGAGADTLDAGLTTMTKRLGEAARGAGAAKPALEQLGLSIQDLVVLSPDQQFYKIADALAKVKTQTERAGLAANIFSKGNMALINTLAQGSEGLQRYQAELERLGGTYSREAAEKAGKANDALDKFWKTMSGATATITLELAPAIEAIANTLATHVPGAVRTAIDHFLLLQSTITSAIHSIAERLAVLSESPGIATLIMGPAAAAGLNRQSQVLRDFADNLADEVTRIEGLRNRINAGGAPGGPPGAPGGAAGDLLGGDGAAAGGAGDPWADPWGEFDRQQREQSAAHRQAGLVLARQFESPLERFERQMAELNRIKGGGGLDLRGDLGGETYRRAESAYRAELQRAQELARLSVAQELGRPSAQQDAVASALPALAQAAPTQMFSGAKERGSAAEHSAVLRAMGQGVGKKGPEKQTAKNTAETVALLQKIVDAGDGEGGVEIPG